MAVLLLLLFACGVCASAENIDDMFGKYQDRATSWAKKNENDPLLVDTDLIDFVKNKELKLSEATMLFTGNIWNDKLLDTVMREGVKIMEPLPLAHNPSNSPRCNKSMKWLQQMFYSSAFKLRPTFQVAVQIDEAIGLKCPFCQHIVQRSPKLWFKRLMDAASKEFKFQRVFGNMHNMEADNRVSVTVDHTLVFKRFKSEDVGTYVCVDSNLLQILKNNPENAVDVISDRFHIAKGIVRESLNAIKESSASSDEDLLLEFVFKISYSLFMTEKLEEKDRVEVFSNEPDQPVPNTTFTTNGLHFFIHWSQWGYCSSCGKSIEIGRRKRFGDCMVKYQMRKSDPKFNAKLHEINRIHFPLGWPCQYHVHEAYISDEDLHKRVPDDLVHFEDCKNVSCVREQLQKNEAEMNEFMLSIEKDRLHKLHYDEEDKKRGHETLQVRMEEPAGANLELHCPNTNLEANVMWRKDAKTLDVKTYNKFTIGRYTISSLSVLKIVNLNEHDTGVFDCIVGPYCHAMFFLNVTVKNYTKFSQDHLYPAYHPLLFFWFSSCSFIVFVILILKCIRYQAFLRALKVRKKKDSKLRKNVIKHIEMNMNALDETFVVGADDTDECYDYEMDGVIRDPVDAKIKQALTH